MRISCPHCGERDLREYEYLGAAKLLARPEGSTGFHDYLHLRENPAGVNTELWQHTMGCRAWLHVLRNVTTHEVLDVALASDVAGAIK